MKTYNYSIEEWWRHLGAYDREQVSHYLYDDFGEDMAWYLSVTDEWWNELTNKQKLEAYNEFFSED